MAAVWGIVQRFGILAAGVVLLWAAAVLGLNLTVLSPGGFVLSYLQALEEGDYVDAARKAGVSTVDALPRPEVAPRQSRIVAVEELADGHLLVVADYDMGSRRHQTSFVLEKHPSEWGLFRTWAFQNGPVGTLRVGVDGGNAVSINASRVAEGAEGISDASVLVPGVYHLSWETPWLESEAVTVAMDRVGDTTAVSLTARPTPAFYEHTEKAVGDYLTQCTEQGVLQPGGCPFGVDIIDRVVGDIEWGVTSTPRVSLTLAEDESTWITEARGGEVTLEVTLQSLFDGSLSPYTETVSFDLVGTIEGVWSGRPTLRID